MPDHLRKERHTIFATAAQWDELLSAHAWLRGSETEIVPIRRTPPVVPVVRLPVMNLDDERTGTVGETRVALTFPLDPITVSVLPQEQPYQPSMRECSICGKDYDGNVHDSCPHPHEPNSKGRK